MIGFQNTTFPEAILQMDLNAEGTRIASTKFLVHDIPEFNIPTTGVIAGDYLYFIANSQMLHINGQRGKIKDAESLKDIAIMKIKLN